MAVHVFPEKIVIAVAIKNVKIIIVIYSVCFESFVLVFYVCLSQPMVSWADRRQKDGH